MKLGTRVSLLVALATGFASVAVATGVLVINFNSALNTVDSRLASIVEQVRSSSEDPLSAALVAVESQEITLVLQADDGSQTVLQDGAGEIGAPETITKSISLGYGEKILFGISDASVFQTLRDSIFLTSLLVTAATLLALLLSRLLLSRDLRVIRKLIHNAEEIASGSESAIASQNGSAELNDLAAALETMVAKLQDSKSQLQAFLSDASHELRTPLTVIRGYLEMLSTSTDLNTDQARKAIARSQTSSLRMQKLINDLLLLAELGEKPSLDMKPTRLATLLRDPVEDLRFAQPDRHIEVIDQQQHELAVANDLFTQFFTNALANIRLYTPTDAAVRIKIAEEQGGLIIEIDDAGPGIADLSESTVRTQFSRFDSERSAGQDSSGLGLSIMAKIIELHGGQMQLSRSDLGGLRVSAHLPAGR